MKEMTLIDAENLWLELMITPPRVRSTVEIATLLTHYILPLVPAKTPASELLAEGIARLRKEHDAHP
jgi:hypothetical protein